MMLQILFEHRTDYSPENLELVQRMALSLIRRNGKGKWSIQRNRNKAIANDQYPGMICGLC